jgi:hypothetical protein
MLAIISKSSYLESKFVIEPVLLARVVTEVMIISFVPNSTTRYNSRKAAYQGYVNFVDSKNNGENLSRFLVVVVPVERGL